MGVLNSKLNLLYVMNLLTDYTIGRLRLKEAIDFEINNNNRI